MSLYNTHFCEVYTFVKALFGPFYPHFAVSGRDFVDFFVGPRDAQRVRLSVIDTAG